MGREKISIFFHNYYGEHGKWLDFFYTKIFSPFDLYYNVVGNSVYNVQSASDNSLKSLLQKNNSLLQNLFVRLSPNKGKDIGGKLVLMDAFLRMDGVTEYIVLLHDKQSPHKIQSQQWREKLFKVVEPDFADKAIAQFSNNPQTGIIAAKDSIRNEFDDDTGGFVSNNKDQLSRLRDTFGFRKQDYRFVAGTMFWVRTKPLVEFFRQYAPLDIRKELEPGNVIDETYGTNTHAWERMLSWIILEKGYNIKGI